MNKNAKGAIAVGAATLLLLGGGGTLAVWNATSDVVGGSIYAGQLALSGGPTEGTWYNYNATAQLDCEEYGAPDELATNHVLVPGDDVIYCIDGLTLTAQGTNLYFVADNATGAVGVSGTGAPADIFTTPVTGLTVDVGVAPTLGGGEFDVITATSGNPNGFTDGTAVPAGTLVYDILGAADQEVIVPIFAYIRVALDADDVVGSAVQGWTFTLGDGAVDVTQVIRTS